MMFAKLFCKITASLFEVLTNLSTKKPEKGTICYAILSLIIKCLGKLLVSAKLQSNLLAISLYN